MVGSPMPPFPSPRAQPPGIVKDIRFAPSCQAGIAARSGMGLPCAGKAVYCVPGCWAAAALASLDSASFLAPPAPYEDTIFSYAVFESAGRFISS